MSEESFHSEHPGGWIEWFCSHEDHLFLCEIDEDFIKDPANSFDFKANYALFDNAIELILSPDMPDTTELQDPQFLDVYQDAMEVYGLLHAKYIQTPIGLAIMRERVLQGRFGHCPRLYCEKQHVIPLGLNEHPKTSRVKVYCPRCEDAYLPKKKCADLDGAFFGRSFPTLLLMTYPDLVPNRGNVRDAEYKKFQPTLYGFRVYGKHGSMMGKENQSQEQSLPLQPQENKQQVQPSKKNSRKHKAK